MVRSGWYETLRPAPAAAPPAAPAEAGNVANRGLRRTVYLAWFPEEGPCISEGRDGFHPLVNGIGDGLERWEWHGPFRTADASRAADLSRGRALRHPFDA